MNTDLKKIYCPQEDCPDNIAFTCKLGGKIPEKQIFSGVLGMNQLGVVPGVEATESVDGVTNGTAAQSLYFSSWKECPRVKDKKK